MGGRGSFIKEGGFVKKRYHVVDLDNLLHLMKIECQDMP